MVKGNHGCGNFTIEAFSNTAASSYRWYRDTFCDYEKLMAKEQGEDPYDLINKQIATSPIGANGITFLSFLQGAGGARINGKQRGTFVRNDTWNKKSRHGPAPLWKESVMKCMILFVQRKILELRLTRFA